MKNFLKHLGLLLVLGSGSVGNAATIYSALNLDGGWSVPPTGGELGSEITVAGSEKVVTNLNIEIYSQGRPFPNPIGPYSGFADFQAQMYANDGAQGAPGSLLWQSSVVHVNYLNGLTLLNFAVPDVLVGNTFTWTLSMNNPSSTVVPPAMPTTLAPTVGSDNTSWFRVPSSSLWTQESGYNYAAEIDDISPVPEPGVGVLLLSGIAIWQLRRKVP